ncbi:hypothetical protein B5S32_g5296 [[Candida] boidinii]|nr:hypothetical protein B5S32_g5296 [[Candida] boidinii]
MISSITRISKLKLNSSYYSSSYSGLNLNSSIRFFTKDHKKFALYNNLSSPSLYNSPVSDELVVASSSSSSSSSSTSSSSSSSSSSANSKRNIKNLNHHNRHEDITSLNQIYDKIKSGRIDDVYDHNDDYNSRHFNKNTFIDGIPNNLQLYQGIQTWSLFEACLKSNDFARAESLLSTLSKIKDENNSSPYLIDGIVQFLSSWSKLDNIKIENLQNWLNNVLNNFKEVKLEPRIYAVLIKIIFDKDSNNIILVNNEINKYLNLNLSTSVSDIFQYSDFIGLDNIRNLINFNPNLKNDLSDDFKQLIDLIEKKEKFELELKLKNNLNNLKKFNQNIIPSSTTSAAASASATAIATTTATATTAKTTAKTTAETTAETIKANSNNTEILLNDSNNNNNKELDSLNLNNNDAKQVSLQQQESITTISSPIIDSKTTEIKTDAANLEQDQTTVADAKESQTDSTNSKNPIKDSSSDYDENDYKRMFSNYEPKDLKIEVDPGVVDNGMNTLRAVSAFNLRAIRHSLIGLEDSYNSKLVEKLRREFSSYEDLPFFSNENSNDNNNMLNGTDKIDESSLITNKKINFFEFRKNLSNEEQIQFDEIFDSISEQRELILEKSMVAVAKRKWEYEFEKIKDKSMPNSVGSYLYEWLQLFKPLIDQQVELYWKVRKLVEDNKEFVSKTSKNSNSISNLISLPRYIIENGEKRKLTEFEIKDYKQALEVGPYLSLLKSDKLASSTILEMIKLASGTDINRGITTSRAVLNIGKAIELEYKAEKILDAEIDVHKNYKAIKKTPEFIKFLRSKKSNYIIEKAERRAIQSNLEGLKSSNTSVSWDSAVRAKIGTVLLSLLLQVARFELEAIDPKTNKLTSTMAPVFFHTYDYINGGKVGLIKVHDKFVSKLLKERIDVSIAPQYLPMICKPLPWTDYNSGGYYSIKDSVLRTKNSVEQVAYVKAASKSKKMDNIFKGLNSLGNTEWTVNKRVLENVIKIWNTGEEFLDIPKQQEDLILPEKPKLHSDPRVISDYKMEARRICNEFSKNRSVRCDLNYKLEIARAFVGERIYFPNSLDFRGRSYPLSPHFNHLGNDVTRSLLLFWKGKKLGKDGLRWLKIHLCNLMGFDKLPLEDRVKFVDDNVENIMDSANDPLGGKRWWLKGDKPWQALATCFEVADALKLDDPTEYISHQPVHQDGTCNGLQHYAALGGDFEGARQVNLIPADKPADVYTHVSRLLKDVVTKDAIEGNEIAIKVQDLISRKVVKQTVMTSVYGVTFIGARDQIKKRLQEIGLNEEESFNYSKYLATKVFQCIRELFDGAHKIQDWFEEAAKRICKSVRLDNFSNYKDPEFQSSVIWTSPLGLPVVQPYRASKTKCVQTNLQNIFISDPYSIEQVDSRKQAAAFPPNFIHSLDATHMLMSAIRCGEKNYSFASVHDSYWTHASDIPMMNQILREEFISLHQNNLVERLKNEFERRYSNSLMVIKVSNKSKASIMVKEFRKKFGNIIGKTPSLSDEIALEIERRNALNSKNPKTVEAGKNLETSISILEGLEIEESNALSGTTKILVPFSLPPIPEKGDFDVSVVKDSAYFFS